MIIIAGNEIVKATASNKILLKRRRDKRVCLKFKSGVPHTGKIKSATIQRSQDGINFYSIGKCLKITLMRKGYIDHGSELFKKLSYRIILETEKKTLIILNSNQQI